jgi:hypothetical protein
MYGAKTDKDGVAISANGSSPILTGECVVGNKLVSLEMAKDQNGNPVTNRATLTFQQKNGATFTHSFWQATEEWAIVQVNREMLHICTKIVSEEEYYSVLEQHGDGTFQGFIKAIADNIVPKAASMTFSLKIVYKENKSNGKWYPNFPKFPNFIEVDGTTPSSLTTSAKYDIYEMPKATDMSTPAVEVGTTSSSIVF